MKNSMLLFSSVWGIFSVIALFLFCFVCVHIIKLAKIGRTYQKENAKRSDERENTPSTQTAQQKTAQQKTAQEKPSEQNGGEPIYYIVERKRRTKSSFGEPKRIHFK